MRTCTECGETKDTEDFRGGRRKCKVCSNRMQNAKRDPVAWNAHRRAQRKLLTPEARKALSDASARWHKENPGSRRKHILSRLYGLTVEEHAALYAAQGGACAVCRTPKPERGRDGLYVDHCHTTGRVRGLLCNTCNIGIGQMQDDPERLLAAAIYLTQ